jgi:hypothetical protein
MDTRPIAAIIALLLGSAGLLVWAAGQGGSPLKQAPSHAAAPHDHASHAGGSVQVVGNHHVEAVVEQGGRVCLYVLAENELELAPIAAEDLVAQVQPEGVAESARVTLHAKPQPGEPAGKASQFAGQVPPSMAGRPLRIVVNVPVDGKHYRVRFEPRGREAAHEEHAEPTAMPAGLGSTEAERDLYLKPHGGYTAADIRANGPLLPSQKFKGIRAEHDMHPKPGDRLCPITNTRANPKFAWIVGGRSYEFCCPPCIDEFVQRAREKPETIRAPEAYVKR